MLAVPEATAQQLDSVLDRAARLYSGARTARGTIEQTVTNSLLNKVFTSSADYQQQFPHKVSISFTDPRGDVIVSDGNHVWMYFPSSTPGVVQKAPLSAAAVWVTLLNSLLASSRSRYTVTDGGRATIGGITTHAVTLIPKEPTPAMLRTKLWIDEKSGEVRQFEVTESADVVRRIRFVTLQLNAAVDEARFTFTPPRGVRVEVVGG
jgi:outer membrane lipoprotein carrier protein